MNENRAGLGYQDFEEIRTKHIFYIDKTDFIREWWENADKVTLITRPRRFGKTLNMSMTECFFSKKYEGRGELFEGLSIWEEQSPDGEYPYRKLQGTFPVIFLSFANVGLTQVETDLSTSSSGRELQISSRQWRNFCRRRVLRCQLMRGLHSTS